MAIKDNGIEFLKRYFKVFERFYRVDKPDPEFGRYRAWASIAKQILGHILEQSIRSKEGKVTEVIITLPLWKGVMRKKSM